MGIQDRAASLGYGCVKQPRPALEKLIGDMNRGMLLSKSVQLGNQIPTKLQPSHAFLLPITPSHCPAQQQEQALFQMLN